MTAQSPSLARLAAACLLALALPAAIAWSQERPAPQPLIQNQRVTVWTGADGGSAPAGAPSRDVVTLKIRRDGADVTFSAKGTARPAAPAGKAEGIVVIELQDTPVPPLPNTSGYPDAFPRAGGRQVLNNSRVVVWDYTWTPGQATPMHFHDKDVVVTYLVDGALTSTDPKGQRVVNPHHFAFTKFNPRNRVHTETLTEGQGRAIIVELK